MNKALILLVLVVVGEAVGLCQTVAAPKMNLAASGSVVADAQGNAMVGIPSQLRRTTNFNSSVYLGDSTLVFACDSLRTDGTATIMTIYETDADSTVGLWQIGSGGNRALWLNSQQACYDNFAITYRNATEKGVVIHTMHYKYPCTDSTYDGHDTLFIGHDGKNVGQKNFCKLLYFSGRLDYQYWRQLESALAIRYGALLHCPYINSQSDTLWNPSGDDSLYSFGICGIGRDDSLSLQQPKSIIRNDYITIETFSPLENLSHVMIGHNGGAFSPGEDVVLVDSVQYAVLDRQWKLKSVGNGLPRRLRISVSAPVPAEAVRLMVTNGDDVEVLTPIEADSIVFDSIVAGNGQDYFITLLVNLSALPNGEKGGHGAQTEEEDVLAENTKQNLRLTMHPNPTSGSYVAEIVQSNEDNIGIQVLDASGRVVEQYETDEKFARYKHTGVFDTGGVYYVTVSSNGLRKTVKIIVVK